MVIAERDLYIYLFNIFINKLLFTNAIFVFSFSIITRVLSIRIKPISFPFRYEYNFQARHCG